MGSEGERLTRAEAFDLARNATAALVSGDDAALSSQVRKKAFELLGRNSESLSERNFHRILRDAHDAEVIDLRRRGDDYEVSLPAKAASVADQVKAAEAAATPRPAPSAAPTPRGMGPRGLPPRGRAGSAPPPELLMVGVVETRPSAPVPAPEAAAAPEKGKKAAAKKGKGEKKAKEVAAPAAAAEPTARARKPRAKAAKKAG